MVRDLSPEIKYARRILSSNKVEIPFDLLELVSKYTRVIYKEIPIAEVDGISLNLKTPGKEPLIIINSLISETRQRFTLAHEFGHLIIPWHLGTIADEFENQWSQEYRYRINEAEANSFAAEILMPYFWIEKLLQTANSLAEIHNIIIDNTGVSPQASAIRLLNFLPKNCVYIAEEKGIIVHSGRSNGSDATTPTESSDFTAVNYLEPESYSKSSFNNINYHWYKLKNFIQIQDTNDTRSWKAILDSILAEVTIPVYDKDIKQSINGVISCAYSRIKNTDNASPEILKADCIRRLNSRNEFVELCSHRDFILFIDKRVKAFFNR